jgi:nucleotide-binding universal stress UspA family protein
MDILVAKSMPPRGTYDAATKRMTPINPALHRFRIVAALDQSEYAEIVLEHAIDQAARHQRPDLHFVAVAARHASVEEARAALATLVLSGLETMGTNGADWRTWLHVLVGDAENEITDLAADLRADLIVVGRFGTHSRRGSTADRVLENAPCPTLVVNLKQDTVSADLQCPECVIVRAASDAEQLFCDQHAGDRVRLSNLVGSSSSMRGGW